MGKLNDIFANIKDLILIDRDWQFLDYVYVSDNSIYGLKVFETNEQLLDIWEKCQMEFASRVQGRLKDKYDGFRWDMYLIIYVNEQVSPSDRKNIENDRMYFRKIVISKDEVIDERLPFNLTYDDALNTFLFGHDHFLTKLKEQLPEETVKIIDKDFFKRGDLYSEDEIYNLLVRK